MEEKVEKARMHAELLKSTMKGHPLNLFPFSSFFLSQGKERGERKAREMAFFLYHDSVQANMAV